VFAKLSKGPGAFALFLHALAVPGHIFTAWFTITTGYLAAGNHFWAPSFPWSVLAMAVLCWWLFYCPLPSGSVDQARGVMAEFGPPGYECDLLYLGLSCGAGLGAVWPLAIDAFSESGGTRAS